MPCRFGAQGAGREVGGHKGWAAAAPGSYALLAADGFAVQPQARAGAPGSPKLPPGMLPALPSALPPSPPRGNGSISPTPSNASSHYVAALDDAAAAMAAVKAALPQGGDGWQSAQQQQELQQEEVGLAALPLACAVASLPATAALLPTAAIAAAQRSSEAADSPPTAHLGTWAQRLFRLPLPGAPISRRSSCDLSPVAEQHPSQVAALATPSKQRSIPSVGGHARSGSAAANGGGGEADEEEAMIQAAWRWRFARRWQAEQTRVVDPEHASADEGDLEETLQYLAVCGVAWDMARTTSTDMLAGAGESAQWDMLRGELSNTAGTPTLLLAGGEDSVSGPTSRHGSSAGHGLLAGAVRSGRSHSAGGRGQQAEALRDLRASARRAAEVLAQQADIERRVNERWAGIEAAAAASGSEQPGWVGVMLESVSVDDWGSFAFVLLLIGEQRGRHRLLVRGANNTTQEKLHEDMRRQVGGPGREGAREGQHDRELGVQIGVGRGVQCSALLNALCPAATGKR